MILIKNADVFTPEAAGICDVLVGERQILAIGRNLSLPAGSDSEVIDAKGLIMVPGLIDNHVHIAGAGGEGGPASRTPELRLSMMFRGGVTTVIGCLGTDGFTRDVTSVLMKVKSLRHEGASAWMLTGAYQVPPPTITGDAGKDIALFEEIIGIGEVALSDHRSSCPTVDELIRLTAHARVAGMIGKKAGIVNIHMGDARDPFRPLHEAVKKSELRYTQFLPTHCNRNDYIFEDSKQYGKSGYIDITTSAWPYFRDEEIKPSKALKILLEAGVPETSVTFSSDACGSLPGFDSNGNLVKLEMGLPEANLRELRDSVIDEKLPLSTALRVLTSNVATILKLPGKGFIARGMDADILLLDGGYEIRHLLAMGRWAVRDGQVTMKGSYEDQATSA
ncbi:MAG: beta-aspartyl-peptidase [Bacteroidales bacterium]|nr:beta-aspartyl-peptidase [Bacteroidales bacterium]